MPTRTTSVNSIKSAGSAESRSADSPHCHHTNWPDASRHAGDLVMDCQLHTMAIPMLLLIGIRLWRRCASFPSLSLCVVQLHVVARRLLSPKGLLAHQTCNLISKEKQNGCIKIV
jgi:hypothetical protein